MLQPGPGSGERGRRSNFHLKSDTRIILIAGSREPHKKLPDTLLRTWGHFLRQI